MRNVRPQQANTNLLATDSAWRLDLETTQDLLARLSDQVSIRSAADSRVRF